MYFLNEFVKELPPDVKTFLYPAFCETFIEKEVPDMMAGGAETLACRPPFLSPSGRYAEHATL